MKSSYWECRGLWEIGVMVDEYQFIVEWEPADRVFVARVTEFPSLAAHGGSQEEALHE